MMHKCMTIYSVARKRQIDAKTKQGRIFMSIDLLEFGPEDSLMGPWN